MRYAIIPFLVYCLIQVIIFFVGSNLVRREEEYSLSIIFRTYIMGQMLVFAIIELLSVPMILLRWRFNTLYWAFIIICLILFVLGVVRFFWKRKVRFVNVKETFRSFTPVTAILLVLVFLIIAAQFSVYFVGQHLDEDDARWLAEANDAIEYGDMMTRDFSTGEYQGVFTTAKEVASPWPMMWAILARTMNTRASIAVHTCYASFELLVMYMIYYLIARELFDKWESRLAFLLLTAVINMFYAGTVYTQSVFSMVRIWQGKATVAAIIIPLLLYVFLSINKRNETRDWLMLPVVSCGACLMSGMGISFSAFMIAIYGVYNIVAYKNWRRIPLFLISLLPSAMFSFIYFYFKG